MSWVNDLVERIGHSREKEKKWKAQRRSGPRRPRLRLLRSREKENSPLGRRREHSTLILHRHKVRPFAEIVHDEIKKDLQEANVFVYAQVGLYELVLRHVFGADWREGKGSVLVRTVEEIKGGDSRTLIVVPVTESGEQFNEVVVKALLTGHAVWVVGYPTVLRKPLWAYFRGVILFQAPEEEFASLREVMGLARSEISSLSPESGEGILGLVAFFSETGERQEFCFFHEMGAVT